MLNTDRERHQVPAPLEILGMLGLDLSSVAISTRICRAGHSGSASDPDHARLLRSMSFLDEINGDSSSHVHG